VSIQISLEAGSEWRAMVALVRSCFVRASLIDIMIEPSDGCAAVEEREVERLFKMHDVGGDSVRPSSANDYYY
jgi:hypothetical protein